MDISLLNRHGDPVIDSSWERSHQHGLRSTDQIHLRYLSRGQLNSRKQQYRRVLEHLKSYFGLFERLQGERQSRLIFADSSGSILHSSGSKRFGSKASRLMLEPGAGWAEATMGTNAIGTALFQQADVQVLGAQHYMEANRGISCSASPVFDPQGQLLGVLDISSEEHAHSHDMLFSARLLALCVENALIADQADACWLLNLCADGLHMQQPWSGLVALNEAGEITGANRIARALLPELQTDQLLHELVPGQIARWGNGSALLTRKVGRGTSHQVVLPERREVPQPDPEVDPRALALLDAGISLLILGETGVGKDHLVRQLHAHSSRSHGPLVAVNCGALPAELIEAELFGYQGGAFTGSDRQGRLGYIRAADRGILFLDEIGELPLSAQTRLLRVLQDKCVTPVGSHVPEQVDFHVLAATNQNLEQLVAEGRFREDLFYRLNGYQVRIPPLRDYSYEAFAALVQRLLAGIAPQTAKPDAAVLRWLFDCSWPGNIRQLKQALEVAAVLADGKPLCPEHFPGVQQAGPAGSSGSPAANLRDKSIEHALRVLDSCQGNVSAAARELGISRTTLYSYLKERRQTG